MFFSKFFSFSAVVIISFHYNYSQSQSNGDFQATWNKQLEILLKKQVFTAQQKSAIKSGTGHCYRYDKSVHDITYGPNASDQVKLASITKIFTSLAALTWIDQQFHDSMSQYQQTAKDFVFTTTLEIYQTRTQKGYSYRANLIGGYDPMFDLKKLSWMLALLNEKTITQLEEIHYTSGFLFHPYAKSNSHSFLEPERFFQGPIMPGEQQMKIWLNNYFNFSAAKNGESYKTINALKKYLFEKSKISQTENLIGLKSNLNIKMSLTHPPILDDHFTPNPDEELAFRLRLYSSPLGKIIKFMNTQSNNWVAESLFLLMGGQNNFRNILQSELPSLSNETKFYTGSGLPDFVSGSKDRLINSARCSEVLQAAIKLYEWDQNSGMLPQDFLGMTGEGTLERYAKDTTSGRPGITFIGKTGTTNEAVNLFTTTSSTIGNIHLFLFSNLPDENYLRTYRRGRWIDDQLNIFQANVRNFYFAIIQKFFSEVFTYEPPTLSSYETGDLGRELNLTSESAAFLNISHHRWEIIDQRFH
ncbi:MAG: D-alanyl-D-alanine carboxypeptidase [Bacteriovoracaceae bacterium]|nr:D-alanyl-D-alanine carboxypeptidase [Bacteriovoracaceae bacterium]